MSPLSGEDTYHGQIVVCKQCGFTFVRQVIVIKITLAIGQYKQLLDDKLITKGQYEDRILDMIQKEFITEISISEAKYCLESIKQLENDDLIEQSTYEKCSDYILAKSYKGRLKNVTV